MEILAGLSMAIFWMAKIEFFKYYSKRYVEVLKKFRKNNYIFLQQFTDDLKK